MKKTSKILAVVLAALLVVAALVVLAACGGEKYDGECKYENKWNPGSYYGVKVTVTVKDGTITAVKLWTDKQTGWTRTSNGWEEDANEGDLGFDKAEAAYKSWIKENIVGKTVEEALAWVASATSDGQTVTSGPVLAGATQSSARIIVAIQDALKKVPAAQ